MFGPSGENRTHGLLNPIQARYQNCATPGYRPPLPYRSVATGNIIRESQVFVNSFLKFFQIFVKSSGVRSFFFDFFASGAFCAASASCWRSSLSFSSSGLRYWPVKLPSASATCSGVPSAMTKPPALPPSGPRSMMWSAHLMRSRLCSMTMTVLPAARRGYTLSCRCRGGPAHWPA